MTKVSGHSDIIPGFEWLDIETGDARIRTSIGGSGPPLLLVHGHPQNHLTWHKVAPRLTRSFTVVMTDLRGYGDSFKPQSAEDHSTYSKRSMAADNAAVMRQLGYDRYRLVAHDRGARASHRHALDFPETVEKLVLLDIAPTRTMYERTNRQFATGYFWWFFMIQPFPIPEKAFEADPDFFLDAHLAGQLRTPGAQHPRVLEEYRRCYRDSATRHAMCEDYRASNTIDLEHDRADEHKRIEAPLMVLWGERGLVGKVFDVLATWREKAVDVRGHGIDCGHTIQEEAPDALMNALDEFL